MTQMANGQRTVPKKRKVAKSSVEIERKLDGLDDSEVIELWKAVTRYIKDKFEFGEAGEDDLFESEDEGGSNGESASRKATGLARFFE
jgi:hypothetical protein